ncbi:PREDICTED: cytosolic 5'-nucleotidase 1A isoform X2 [Aptenodytes forsteri]|uniref:cytosolic 5'-nucleotidase 1A isoform X2 n=1 Tax=Aptenodytes forsteri TaxID=9233 RepID=UPI00090569B7|nr:PREDICTED: cytosolic 5'-nucleotidase 1A isoform X2 [Aptenodytes forsteri]
MAEPESTVINTDVKQKDPSEALVIAVTTRAIFNLEEEHKLYLEKGKEEYARHQQANQDKPLPPGTAFAFIQAAQYVNEKILESNLAEKDLFDILVVSNNSPESGVRIINSAKHYGVSAALVFQQEVQAPSTPLRVVFDGDAVLFSNETDQVFQEQGLEGAVRYERAMEAVPMGEGPLKAFAMHLGKIRKKFSQEKSPIRTYLVTARSGRDMGVRAIKTLQEWGLAIDEAFFMDGAPKGPILAQIQPHIFFDDGLHNIQGAQDVGVPSAWVPSCY